MKNVTRLARVLVPLILVAACGSSFEAGSSSDASADARDELAQGADSPSPPAADAGDAGEVLDAISAKDSSSGHDAGAGVDASADVEQLEAGTKDTGTVTPICPLTTACIGAVFGCPAQNCPPCVNGQCPSGYCCSAWDSGTSSDWNECTDVPGCLSGQ